MVNNWPQLYSESVADVSEVAEDIGKAQGGFYDVSRAVASDGKRWIAIPWTVGGGLLTNRRSWFAEVGYSEGKFPETWEEYRLPTMSRALGIGEGDGSRVRTGLAAGESRIRTLGPAS